MPLDLKEKMALEEEKRAVQYELQEVDNEIRRLGGGHNPKTWSLQARRSSVAARLNSIRSKLGLC